jgi:hypothetical protein
VMNRSFEEEKVRCVFVMGENTIATEDLEMDNSFEMVFDSTRYPGSPKKSRFSNEADELGPYSATVYVKGGQG